MKPCVPSRGGKVTKAYRSATKEVFEYVLTGRKKSWIGAYRSKNKL